MASLNLSPPAARYHGDQAVAPGMLDFAVNVRHGRPPEWLLRRLADRLPELGRYPGVDDVHGAAAHGIDTVVVGWGYGKADFPDGAARSTAAAPGVTHASTIDELRRALGV